jgi:hypothetical protein
MREYAVELLVPGMSPAWLAETVVRGLDTAVQEGRATKEQAEKFRVNIFFLEDGERERLDENERATVQAFIERRQGGRYDF